MLTQIISMIFWYWYQFHFKLVSGWSRVDCTAITIGFWALHNFVNCHKWRLNKNPALSGLRIDHCRYSQCISAKFKAQPKYNSSSPQALVVCIIDQAFSTEINNRRQCTFWPVYHTASIAQSTTGQTRCILSGDPHPCWQPTYWTRPPRSGGTPEYIEPLWASAEQIVLNPWQ